MYTFMLLLFHIFFGMMLSLFYFFQIPEREKEKAFTHALHQHTASHFLLTFRIAVVAMENSKGVYLFEYNTSFTERELERVNFL